MSTKHQPCGKPGCINCWAPATGFDGQAAPHNPAATLALITENERLSANVKLNLCDYSAIHKGDIDLLIAFVGGTSQTELANVHGCTPPNISRKVRRVKQRLGWKAGMGPPEIIARAEQLRALASRGAVVTADLIAENERLKNHVQSMIDQATPLVPIAGDPGWSRRITIDELQAEVAELRRDAERYRWLNRQRRSVWRELGAAPRNRTGELIDAAMSKETHELPGTLSEWAAADFNVKQMSKEG